jgi:hypothetical protein
MVKMNSLFKRIYLLLKNTDSNPFEDYLTEVIAEVFESDKVLKSFATTFIDSSIRHPQLLEITTQKTFSKQEEHQVNSRPDLVLRFMDGHKSYVIFFENKLGSHEGDTQLKRYADHLRPYENEGCKTYLFYLTQFYDPKDKDRIIPKGSKTTFNQIRWYEIYNWLKENQNEYINKVLEYMEERNLNETRRFVPQDVYAIQNMQRLIHMMDSCLDGQVEDTMTSLFGRATGWTNRFVQLRSNYRYMKYNDLGNYSAIAIGFYLTDEEYPSVCIMYEVNPNCPKRADIISAMKKFVKDNPDWETENIDDPSAWSNIYCEMDLLSFLSDQDHIDSIQIFFMNKLKELYTLKQENPDLDWK